MFIPYICIHYCTFSDAYPSIGFYLVDIRQTFFTEVKTKHALQERDETTLGTVKLGLIVMFPPLFSMVMACTVV